MDILVAGIAMGFSLAAPVGPVNIETVKRGFHSGFRAAFSVGLGAFFGDALYCVLLLAGLVPFIAGIPGLERVLWGIGSLIMLYLGWGGIKEFWSKDTVDLSGGRPAGAAGNMAVGFTAAFFNPYAFLWYLTAGGAFVSTGVSRGGMEGGTAAVLSFLSGVFLWMLLLAAGVHWARRYITPFTMRVISGLSGVALWGFAVWFAVKFFAL